MEGPVRIAIIDDCRQWAERLQIAVAQHAALSLIGTARTPRAAVELISARKPEIVILDLALEEGSGVEVLERLSELGVTAQVVVVAASSSRTLRETCLRLGARFFLDKAYDFDRLGAVLEQLVAEAVVH
jgi:two-component system OmpR family response regulator